MIKIKGLTIIHMFPFYLVFQLFFGNNELLYKDRNQSHSKITL